MRYRIGCLAVLALALAATAAVPAAAHSRDTFAQINLASDVPGFAHVTDANLVNAWGLAAGPATPLWVANNHSNTSTLYSGANGVDPFSVSPLVVSISDSPTGLVFNGSPGFVVSDGKGHSASAPFIFSTESGQIVAWSPTVPPPPPSKLGFTVVTTPGAVYKGLAIGAFDGHMMLYATDFHDGRIDVFNDSFAPQSLPGSFTDSKIPAGFAPFGIQEIGNRLVVTYAKQDADAMDDSAGPGNGFVDIFTNGGKLVRRLVRHGALNSPWGIAVAPRHFGHLGRTLLIGNFGDGAINAYNPRNGHFVGTLRDGLGEQLHIDGLWALRPGDRTTGPRDSIVFSAGPDGENHGLLGLLLPSGRR
jgi:uncharacterized protein (TIGR03118 family)